MSQPFKFKHFTILQESNTQKVGTDSMLLGAWVTGKFNRILDIGTGTGILALMMAQKNPEASITAIEPDLESLSEAQINFSHSTFKNQLLAIHTPLQSFGAIDKFDLIITNPPYFENSFLSEDTDRNRARHTNDLPIHELYGSAAELLTDNGSLAIVIPSDLEYEHFKRAAFEDLFPFKILRTISPNGNFKRTLIQFSFEDTEPIETTLLVKDDKGNYSKEYIEMTKEFYGKDLSQ